MKIAALLIFCLLLAGCASGPYAWQTGQYQEAAQLYTNAATLYAQQAQSSAAVALQQASLAQTSAALALSVIQDQTRILDTWKLLLEAIFRE